MIDPNDIVTLEALKRAAETRGLADEQALADWIAEQPVERRTDLATVAAEVLQARVALGDVPMPPGLESQLLQIADAPPPWHWRDLLKYQLKNWQIAVAMAAVALMVAWSIWPTQPPRPPTLDDQAVHLISDSAVQHQSTEPKITSDDPAKVLAMLKTQPMAFEAKLPEVHNDLKLLGGGVTTFGNAPALFTRWHGSEGDFTLYQFDAKALKLPGGFMTTSLTLGATPQPITIWPGRTDAYAWALVGAAGCDVNPFYEPCEGE